MPTAEGSRLERMRPARRCIRREQRSVFLAYITIPFIAINYCAAKCGRPRARPQAVRACGSFHDELMGLIPQTPAKPSPIAPFRGWASIPRGTIWEGFTNCDEKTLTGQVRLSVTLEGLWVFVWMFFFVSSSHSLYNRPIFFFVFRAA